MFILDKLSEVIGGIRVVLASLRMFVALRNCRHIPFDHLIQVVVFGCLRDLVGRWRMDHVGQVLRALTLHICWVTLDKGI